MSLLDTITPAQLQRYSAEMRYATSLFALAWDKELRGDTPPCKEPTLGRVGEVEALYDACKKGTKYKALDDPELFDFITNYFFEMIFVYKDSEVYDAIPLSGGTREEFKKWLRSVSARNSFARYIGQKKKEEKELATIEQVSCDEPAAAVSAPCYDCVRITYTPPRGGGAPETYRFNSPDAAASYMAAALGDSLDPAAAVDISRLDIPNQIKELSYIFTSLVGGYFVFSGI